MPLQPRASKRCENTFLNLRLVHQNVYHVFFLCITFLCSNACLKKVMCSMLSARLTRNARLNTLCMQDYPTWVFSARNTAIYFAPVLRCYSATKNAFEHFMPEVMNKRARHAQARMNSSKTPKSAKTGKSMASNTKVRVYALQKISRSFPHFAYQNLNRANFCVPLGGAG